MEVNKIKVINDYNEVEFYSEKEIKELEWEFEKLGIESRTNEWKLEESEKIRRKQIKIILNLLLELPEGTLDNVLFEIKPKDNKENKEEL